MATCENCIVCSPMDCPAVETSERELDRLLRREIGLTLAELPPNIDLVEFLDADGDLLVEKLAQMVNR